jgi:hypothetical protein
MKATDVSNLSSMPLASPSGPRGPLSFPKNPSARFERRGRISSSSDAMIAALHLLRTFVANLFKSRRPRSIKGQRSQFDNTRRR